MTGRALHGLRRTRGAFRRAWDPANQTASAVFAGALLLLFASVLFGGASQTNALSLMAVELASLPLLFISLYLVLARAAPAGSAAPLVLLALVVAAPIAQLVLAAGQPVVRAAGTHTNAARARRRCASSDRRCRSASRRSRPGAASWRWLPADGGDVHGRPLPDRNRQRRVMARLLAGAGDGQPRDRRAADAERVRQHALLLRRHQRRLAGRLLLQPQSPGRLPAVPDPGGGRVCSPLRGAVRRSPGVSAAGGDALRLHRHRRRRGDPLARRRRAGRCRPAGVRGAGGPRRGAAPPLARQHRRRRGDRGRDRRRAAVRAAADPGSLQRGRRAPLRGLADRARRRRSVPAARPSGRSVRSRRSTQSVEP